MMISQDITTASVSSWPYMHHLEYRILIHICEISQELAHEERMKCLRSAFRLEFMPATSMYEYTIEGLVWFIASSLTAQGQ